MGGGLSLVPPIFALFGFSSSTSFSNSRTFEPSSKTGSGFMYTLHTPQCSRSWVQSFTTN